MIRGSRGRWLTQLCKAGGRCLLLSCHGRNHFSLSVPLGPFSGELHSLNCVFCLTDGAGAKRQPWGHRYPPKPSFVEYADSAKYRHQPCPWGVSHFIGYSATLTHWASVRISSCLLNVLQEFQTWLLTKLTWPGAGKTTADHSCLLNVFQEFQTWPVTKLTWPGTGKTTADHSCLLNVFKEFQTGLLKKLTWPGTGIES